VGCSLPWEQVTVAVAPIADRTAFGTLHGSGIAAVCGAVLALATAAHRLWTGRRWRLHTVLTAAAATSILAGCALFTVTGGFPPERGDGYAIELLPGFALASASGVSLLATAILESRLPSP
jgi:hypothetical protein